MTQFYECRLHTDEILELPKGAVEIGKPHGTGKGFTMYRFPNRTFHQLRPCAPPEAAPEITVIVTKPVKPTRVILEPKRPEPVPPAPPPEPEPMPEWVPDPDSWYTGWMEYASPQGFGCIVLDDSQPYIRVFLHASQVQDRPQNYTMQKGDLFSLRIMPSSRATKKMQFEAVEAYRLKKEQEPETETTFNQIQAAFDAAKE